MLRAGRTHGNDHDPVRNELLKERRSRPLISDIADEDLSRYVVRKLSERRMYYQQADVTVNEESVTLDGLIRLLLQDEQEPDRMKEELKIRDGMLREAL